MVLEATTAAVKAFFSTELASARASESAMGASRKKACAGGGGTEETQLISIGCKYSIVMEREGKRAHHGREIRREALDSIPPRGGVEIPR